MPDDSVKFTINIEEKPDASVLEDLIKNEVEKRMREIREQSGPGELSTPGADEGEGGVYDSQGRWVGGGGLISEYGYGHEPRAHYPKKRTRRQLPETGFAPFEIDDGTIPGFGGSAYLNPRGFQQEKVNRRGAIRKNEFADNTPLAGFQPKTVRQQLRDMQKLMDTEHFADMLEGKIQGTMSKLGKGAQAITNPQAFVGDTVMTMLSGAGPYGKVAVAAIGAIVVSAAVAHELIKVLAQKGLPLNRDWHRNLESEMMAGLQNLDEQARRFVGLDNFIIAQTAGYKPIDGTDVYTHMEDRDEDRIARSGQGFRAWGTQ